MLSLNAFRNEVDETIAAHDQAFVHLRALEVAGAPHPPVA